VGEKADGRVVRCVAAAARAGACRAVARLPAEPLEVRVHRLVLVGGIGLAHVVEPDIERRIRVVRVRVLRFVFRDRCAPDEDADAGSGGVTTEADNVTDQ
jgi:hypothetical protein